jgi:hypothetical protein
MGEEVVKRPSNRVEWPPSSGRLVFKDFGIGFAPLESLQPSRKLLTSQLVPVNRLVRMDVDGPR